jgi:hypothetical protein
MLATNSINIARKKKSLALFLFFYYSFPIYSSVPHHKFKKERKKNTFVLFNMSLEIRKRGGASQQRASHVTGT